MSAGHSELLQRLPLALRLHGNGKGRCVNGALMRENWVDIRGSGREAMPRGGGSRRQTSVHHLPRPALAVAIHCGETFHGTDKDLKLTAKTWDDLTCIIEENKNDE